MFLKKIGTNLFLILLASLYYLIFINKGIVLYDEGYYAHIADRIVSGQVPYRDFFLQFTPGYFYLLALFYKLFGVSVFTGRILTLVICIGIVYLSLRLLDKFKIDFRLKFLSFLAVLAYGFPLINNMSLLAWPVIFLTILMILFFIERKYILLGIVLSLVLFTKQNIGIYFFILTNLFLIISKSKIKNIFLTNSSFIILTIIWFSYFFLILNGIDKFRELLDFSSRYLSVYHFSYPPLSFLLQPTGVFKLLPYYLPVIFGFILLANFLNRKKNFNIFYFSTVSLAGFFGTIYPTSDLLHVYPFLGLVIVSSIIFFKEKNISIKSQTIIVFVTGIMISSGFYLSLFKEYYRYQPPYHDQKVQLELSRTKNIYIDKPLAFDLASLNLFFLINTKKGDSILCYPFCPMLYFILEKDNPSRFSNYYPGYLTKKEEENVLLALKQHRTKFIITFLKYKFDTPISRFIQKQKMVYQTGEFNIFQIY